MKRYVNNQFAKKLLIAGGILYAVSFVLNFVTAQSVYGKVEECFNKSAGCTLTAEQIFGKIAAGIGFAGIGIFFIGLALLLTVWVTKKKTTEPPAPPPAMM